MAKYEHKVVALHQSYHSKPGEADVSRALAPLGSLGWHVVGFVQTHERNAFDSHADPDGLMIILEREVVDG